MLITTSGLVPATCCTVWELLADTPRSAMTPTFSGKFPPPALNVVKLNTWLHSSNSAHPTR